MHPLVVHVRDMGGAEALYIGRWHRSPRYGTLPESPYHNPFYLVSEADRWTVLVEFTGHLFDDPELVEQAKRELKGRTLACWCAPRPCHGDVLAWVANEGLGRQQCLDRIEQLWEEDAKRGGVADRNGRWLSQG